MKSAAALIIVPVLMLFLNGCDIASPEPTLETQINAASAIEYAIGDFRPGDHVAGTVTLTLPRDLVAFEIGEVAFYLDSLRLRTFGPGSSAYSYSLPTADYAQTNHLLSIAVYEKTPTLGMMNVAGAPRVVFMTSAVFDQTPPTIDSLRVDNVDGEVVIRWAAPTQSTSKRYFISASFSSRIMPGPLVYTQTITDPAATSWRINASPYPLGTTVAVSVTATNGVTNSPLATATGMIGYALGSVASPIRQFWPHPSRSETYAWAGDNRMYVLGADGTTLLRTSPVLQGVTSFFSRDGSKFYLFDPAQKRIDGYSTLDFSHAGAAINLPAASSPTTSQIVLSPNGRFYVSNADGTLWIYSEATGALLSTTTLQAQHVNGRLIMMAASDDGRWLFYNDGSWGICRMNIAAETPVVELRTAFTQPMNILAIDLTNDQKHLLVSHYDGSSLQMMDTGDLRLGASLQLTGNSYSSELYSVACVQSGMDLFVVSKGRYVQQFDLTTNQAVKSWNVVDVPQSIAVSRDGRRLLLGAIGGTTPNLYITR